MLIRELFESRFFKDEDFVQPKDGGREINFDMVEDLIHFMNHDDDVYRRHVYPSIAKCIDIVEAKKRPKASIFKSAVDESYRKYVREFPIRELPDTLDEETCQQVCDKLRETVCNDIAEGKYRG